MARRKTCRSDRAVRVSFEISRLSERIMIDVYEQVLPISQRRPRPVHDPVDPAVRSPDPVCKNRS